MSSVTAKAAVAALKVISSGDAFGGDMAGRMTVVAAAKELLARVQTPSDQLREYTFNSPVILASMQTLWDLGIWQAWDRIGGGEKTLEELVSLANTSVMPALLQRLLKLLAASLVIQEVAEDKYKPTAFSTALAGKIGETLSFGTDHCVPSALALASFLQQKKYQHEVAADRNDTPYAHMACNPSRLDFFGRCQSDPERLFASFSTYMDDWTASKPDWTSTFDTRALLLSDGAEALVRAGTTPFIVDMGGHYGRDITRARRRHPDLPPDAFVLQDLPEIVAVTRAQFATEADLQQVRVLEHDFFTAQPVAGARAYFMHAILHDWPDAAARDLFANLRPAMTPGYSKLLICDIVIPPTGATLVQTVMDLQVLSTLGAKERTRADWERLLGENGFGNVKIYPDDQGNECVIEADIV